MKKRIISFVLMFGFCFSFLSGCGPSATPAEVKTTISEFFLNETNAKIINAEMDYPNAVQNQINNNQNYAILNVYHEILKAEFFICKNNYGSFAVTPLNTKNQGKFCEEILKSLENLKEQISIFNESKTHYFAVIEKIELSNIIAENNLQIYKKAYGLLIEKANEFNNAFIDAYISLYGNLKLETTENSDIKSAVYYAFSDFLSTYVRYAFTEFDGVHAEKTAFYDGLKDLINKLAQTSVSYKSEKYNEWLELYMAYNVEKQIFIEALNSIDARDAEVSGEKNQVYKNKITNFVSTNAKLMIDKTLQLIA